MSCIVGDCPAALLLLLRKPQSTFTPAPGCRIVNILLLERVGRFGVNLAPPNEHAKSGKKTEPGTPVGRSQMHRA